MNRQITFGVSQRALEKLVVGAGNRFGLRARTEAENTLLHREALSDRESTA